MKGSCSEAGDAELAQEIREVKRRATDLRPGRNGPALGPDIRGQSESLLLLVTPQPSDFRSHDPGRGLCLLGPSESRFPRRAFPGLHGRYSRRPAMPAWLQCMERGPDQPIGID